LSTTALAILQGARQEDNPYKAGTLRERAYIRSLNPARLASQANINLLNNNALNNDALDNKNALDKALDKAILAGEFNQPLLKDDDNNNQGEPSQILPLQPKQFLSQPIQ
jgi:hypothetical protein